MYHNITIDLRELVCKKCMYLSGEAPIYFGPIEHRRTIIHCNNSNVCPLIRDVRYRTTKDSYEHMRKLVLEPDLKEVV